MPQEKSTWISSIPFMLAQLAPALESDVEATLNGIRERARLTCPSPERGNPNSTGATKEGLAIVSGLGSDYDQRADDAVRIGGERLKAMILAEPTLPPLVKATFGGMVVDVLAYGNAIEWGTSRMSAQPFMGPSAAEEFPYMVERVEKTLRRIING